MSKKPHQKSHSSKTTASRVRCSGCSDWTSSHGFCPTCVIFLQEMAGDDLIKRECIASTLRAARQFGLSGAEARAMALDAITRFETEVLKWPVDRSKLVD